MKTGIGVETQRVPSRHRAEGCVAQDAGPCAGRRVGWCAGLCVAWVGAIGCASSSPDPQTADGSAASHAGGEHRGPASVDDGAGHDGAGHDGAGHDGAGHDGAGHDGAGHDGAGHDDHDHAHGHPGAQAHRGQGHDHDFSDVDRFAEIFDDPDRDRWQRPRDIVASMALAPGMVVADIGAGTGYFLPYLVPAVQPAGRVLGLDVEPNMVRHMEARIRDGGLEGAEARVVATDDPGLAPGTVDRILIVDTWHHIQDRVAYGRRLAAALAPEGALFVVDFRKDSPQGPPPAMRLDAEAVLRELREAGFEAEQLPVPLPYQYVLRAAVP